MILCCCTPSRCTVNIIADCTSSNPGGGLTTGDLTVTLDGAPFYSGSGGSTYTFAVGGPGTYVFTVPGSSLAIPGGATNITPATWTYTYVYSGGSFATPINAAFTYTCDIGCQCFCCPPDTLTMTSADETCNFDMFQSCTLTYQPTPSAWAPLRLPANIYTSYPEGFPDPIAGGAIFYYYLTCQYNQFTLSRIYTTSPYGSPFHDGILYTWLLGGYEDTCQPFHLDSGSAFPGSDASCSVTIDG